MLDLGSTEFVLAVPSVSEHDLRRLSSSLFGTWESFVHRSVAIPDYSLHLQVEEGSVKGVAQIGAMLGAIYMGIGHYGEFVHGLKTINEQITATADYVSEQAQRVFSCPPTRANLKKKSGTLVALQRLFIRVQKGELTPEEAISRAEILLGDDSSQTPGFMSTLAGAFRDCPRLLHQEQLPFLDEAEESDALPATQLPRPRRPAPLAPELAPPLQLRVEVWRESKNKRKHTRIVKI